MTIYVEDPTQRIVAVHWADEGSGSPPEPPDIGYLCGYFEQFGGVGGFTTITDHTGTPFVVTDEYVNQFMLDHDPPDYPHDIQHHSWPGVTLGPDGILWNIPVQPPNPYNVPMRRAFAFRIEIDRQISAHWEPPPPGSFGYYVTWTNFFDLSTWVWLPNTPVPRYTFPTNEVALGFSNMYYATGPNQFPPPPPTPFITYGNVSLEHTDVHLDYFYQVEVGPQPVAGQPPPPPPPPPPMFDPSGGGTGTFWFMSPTNNPIKEDHFEPWPAPGVGLIYWDNTPNVVDSSFSHTKITGFCHHPDDGGGSPGGLGEGSSLIMTEVPPLVSGDTIVGPVRRHNVKVDMNKIRAGVPTEQAIING